MQGILHFLPLKKKIKIIWWSIIFRICKATVLWNCFQTGTGNCHWSWKFCQHSSRGKGRTRRSGRGPPSWLGGPPSRLRGSPRWLCFWGPLGWLWGLIISLSSPLNYLWGPSSYFLSNLSCLIGPPSSSDSFEALPHSLVTVIVPYGATVPLNSLHQEK